MVAARHNGEIVRCTFRASVSAIAELEKGLRAPLTGSAAFGVPGEPHTGRLERSVDDELMTRGDVGGARLLQHLEARSNLVKGDLFRKFAVVPNAELEGICSPRINGSIGNDGCCTGSKSQDSG